MAFFQKAIKTVQTIEEEVTTIEADVTKGNVTVREVATLVETIVPGATDTIEAMEAKLEKVEEIEKELVADAEDFIAKAESMTGGSNGWFAQWLLKFSGCCGGSFGTLLGISSDTAEVVQTVVKVETVVRTVDADTATDVADAATNGVAAAVAGATVAVTTT